MNVAIDTVQPPRPNTDLFRAMIDRLPAAAYACDAGGLVTYFNQKAEEVWGRAPKLNHEDDRYCGSYRLFSSDGAPIAHKECWMALALLQRKEFLAREIIVERPNAALVHVLAYATPIFDQAGNLVAGINVLVNISVQKRLERLLRDANETKDVYMSTLADELRAQILAMETSLSRLRQDLAPGAAGLQSAEEIRSTIGEMSALISQLLDVPRREACVPGEAAA